MAVKFSNNAATVLAADITSSATSITVADGSVFPTLSGSEHTYVTLEDLSVNREIVKVTAISGNSLTVVRAQDGTSARAFSTADKCELRITAASLNDLSTQADTESVSRTGDSMTGDLSFGDNDKATFGASDDLQIYHDGFHSYIKESGAGSLIIDATNTYFRNAAGTKDYLDMVDGGAVTIKYDNAAKLATTSTGIDVTGTATMDGLTVERENLSDLKTWSNSDVGSIGFYQAASYPSANNYGRVLDINSGSGNSNDGSTIRLLTSAGNSEGKQRLSIASNGDISFFEDTGTTPKLTWDASAELLTTTGLDVTGTATMDGLVVDGSALVRSGNTLTLNRTDNAIGGTMSYVAGTGFIFDDANGDGTSFNIGAMKKMRIASNGDISFYEDTGTTPKLFWDASAERLGVGTSSPAAPLTVSGDTTQIRLENTASGGRNWALRTFGSALGIYDHTAGAFRQYIDSSGRVGIGTSSPSSPLHIYNATTDTIANFESGDVSVAVNITASDNSMQIATSSTDGILKNNGAGSLRLFNNGSERLRIDSSGNVGIGTSSPDTLLEVVGADPILTIRDTETSGASSNATLRLAESGASDTLNNYWDINHTGGSALRFVSKIGVTTAERMRIDLSGNVGIGTSSPSHEIDLTKTLTTIGQNPTLQVKNSWATEGNNTGFDNKAIGLFSAGADTVITKIQSRYDSGANVGQIGTQTNHDFLFTTNDTERLRIDSAGRVGIGTSSPNKKLDIYGSNAGEGVFVRNSDNGNYRGYYMGAADNDNTVYASVELNASSGQLRHYVGPSSYGGYQTFHTSGTERMRIDSSGRVGIGTSSPAGKLDVLAGSDQRLIFTTLGTDPFISAVNGANSAYKPLQLNGSDMKLMTGGSERMRIDSSGNVGIGASSPNNETNRVSLELDDTWGGVFQNSVSGTPKSEWRWNTSGHTVFGSVANEALAFSTNSTERMRIDSSGRVGIGTTSPSSLYAGASNLVVGGGSSESGMTIYSSDTTDGNIYFADGTSGSAYYSGFLEYSHGSNYFRVGVNAAERMRIDSSGNLLVGKTSNSYSTAGAVLGATGSSNFTRDGNPAVGINRLSSDGSLINFAKDGTTVGSISSDSGSHLIIKGAGNNAALLFNHASSRIEPYSNSATDLGRTHAKFKDLHLSGTVNTEAVSTEAVSTNSLDLQAIAESKSVTAVDVFVYDTSKDSDGGAWRHRTQGTSWYNEALNTSTRGATKKFPAVAVIVAESNKVTIYDGDDPAMPFWMQFDVGGSNSSMTMLNRGSNDLASVEALNGVMGVGTLNQNNHSGGLRKFNFIADYCYIHDDNSTYTGFHKGGGISKRNSQVGNTPNASGSIVARTVNDVAMTVLPNAPIDADTGLPVPTIAVATDGGVSVIKDDGSVVDITNSNSSFNFCHSITLNESGRLSFVNGYSLGTNSWVYVFNSLPTADNVITINTKTGSTQNADAMYDARGSSSVAEDLVLIGGQDDINATTERAVGVTAGLTLLDENITTPTEGSVAYITSDYNTGWMNGDIKLATLSDTDDTNVTGSELVSQTASGWTLPTGYSHNGSGTLTAASNTGQYQKAYDVIDTVVGKTYTVTFNVTAKSGSMSFWVANSSSYSSAFATENPISGTGVKSFSFTPTSTSMFLVFQCNSLGNTITVSDISVRLAEPDRSVNGNGLRVHGTVTKSAVATGAELVAYSGFSSSNYLQQPHQSYMDDVSGNWSATHWGKVTGSTTQVFWEISQVGTDLNGDGSVLSYISNGLLKCYMKGNAGAQPWENTSGFAINDNVWHQYTYTKVGNLLTVYQDGIARDTKTLAGDGRTYNEPTSVLQLGSRSDGAGGILDNGAMTLFRFSATAPSAEQIAKMYRDEKPLFQANAKATLYGTSDAVTALAYDDDTELLHAGTSAGRSVFQGLRRVDNTTDAVGVAISASNDLVVEE